MPLVPPDADPVEPAEPTLAERFREQMVAHIIQATNMLEKKVYNELMHACWDNSQMSPFRAMSPKDRVEALGTQATEIFQLASSLASLVLAAKPSAVLVQPPYDKWTPVFHADGSMTLTDNTVTST